MDILGNLHSTSGRDGRASYRTISVPLGFGPVIAFGAKFQPLLPYMI